MQDTTPENQGVKDVSAGECTQVLEAEALALELTALEQERYLLSLRYRLDGETAPPLYILF